MNITKSFVIAAIMIILSINVYADNGNKHNYKPKDGYVPNKETAIKIAIAIWGPIYGEKKIEEEKPYSAVLKDGIWFVSSSLPKNTVSEVTVGGVAEAEISKDNGRIIRITHGK